MASWLTIGSGLLNGAQFVSALRLKNENAALRHALFERDQQIAALGEQVSRLRVNLGQAQEAHRTAEVGRQRAQERALAAETELETERVAHAKTSAALVTAEAEVKRLDAEFKKTNAEIAKHPSDPATKSKKTPEHATQ